MRRLLPRLLGVAGWVALGLAAALGVGLSALVGLTGSQAGGAVLSRLVTAQVHGLVAGRLEVEEAAVLPRGAVELRGVRLYDPEGRLVLQAPRARLFPDLGRLLLREIGLVVEVDAPSVLLETAPDGSVSLLRALASAAPASGPGIPSWRLRLDRLTVRGGELWWQGADRSTSAELTGLELDASGAAGPAGGELGLQLRAALRSPGSGPLALGGAVQLRGDRVELRALRASLGPSSLELVGDADLATGAFRAAVTRFHLSAAEARRLLPQAAPDGDLVGTAYAESDGRVATLALDLRPGGGGAEAGQALAAVAVRLPMRAPAAGYDLALAALDPARLLAGAPQGQVTLTARGAADGHGLADGRGWLALALAPSRLRGGELGPVSLLARGDRGLVTVTGLDARMPGLAVTGGGRWRAGGAPGAPGSLGAELALDAADLGRLGPNLSALTGLALPELGGRLRGRVEVGGTGAAPTVRASLRAPRLTAGALVVEGAELTLDAAGPRGAASGHLAGTAARASIGASRAGGLTLTAAVVGGEATLSLSASAGERGDRPVTVEARARLTGAQDGARVEALTLAWPGARMALVRPALVTFTPLAVDRLELVGGRRRLLVAGGLGPRDALDLRLEAAGLELAELPGGLFPPGADLGGELSLEARATGTAARPVLASRVGVTGGRAAGLTGLELRGDLGWAGATGLLTAKLRLARGAGGALDVDARLVWPPGRGRPEERLALTAEAAGWPVGVLRAFGDLPEPLDGLADDEALLGGRLALSGTAAAPRLRVALALEEPGRADPTRLGGTLELELSGGAARLTGAARLGGAPALTFEAGLPLDLAGLLRRPEATLRAAGRGPLEATVEVAGLELAALAGRAGLPEPLAGRLTGHAALTGSLAAPRGRVSIAVAGGALAGYRDLAVQAELVAAGDSTTLGLRAAIAGAEALRLDAALGAPVERLADRAVLRAAPLSLQATVPPLALAAVGGPSLPLAGSVSASLSLKGALAAPEGRLDLAGAGVVVEGRPLGAVKAMVRSGGGTSAAELSLHPTAGGALQASATLAAALGLDVGAEGLGRTPATLRVTSQALDLGFLPALLPGVVRTASGSLTVDLTASGTPSRLRTTGAVRLSGGALAVTEWGAWSELALEAALGDGTIEVSRLEARHGAGRLSGHLSVRDLGTPLAHLAGQVTLKQLAVTRSGMELATLDAVLDLGGTWSDDLLDGTVSLPGGGTLRLPTRSPRTLQSLEQRKDILVGRPRPKRASWLAWLGPGGLDATPRRPFEVRCRLLVPGKLFVKGDDPTVDVELKGDSTWRLVGGELLADGQLELVRGTLEPLSGRLFHLERGRLTFGGGAWKAGQLDVVARYDNPAAVVTVTVGGTVAKPTIALVSLPAMDEASIAMLVATGRSEIKVNTSGVGTLTAQEVGTAAASAAVGMAFKGLLADKLPVDQVSLDATALRAGKYLTDKLFVGYLRRFEAKPELGENTNEVRAEYQLSRRWTFELRYGDAQAGDGSLIWSKEY